MTQPDLSLPCCTCFAQPGEQCRTNKGKIYERGHSVRRGSDWRAEIAEQKDAEALPIRPLPNPYRLPVTQGRDQVFFAGHRSPRGRRRLSGRGRGSKR